MWKELLKEFKNSCFSVFPIYILVIILLGCQVITLSDFELHSFTIATLLVIIGISLFNYGANNAMTPIGKKVGKGLTKQGKIWILFLVVFIFGFFITIAEPDLTVLASQTESVFNRWTLIISIGLSVGFFLLLAILKIVKKVNLTRILSVLYMFSFALMAILCYFNKESMIALCFDSGGVTTGPMTVPFIMALGAGVASVLAQKSEKDASFGFIAFSSIGPIIVMLVLSLLSTKTMSYETPTYTLGEHFFMSYLECVWEKVRSVGLSVGLLLVCFVVIDLIFLKIEWKKMLKLFVGLLFVYVGLVIFLAAVDSTYIAIGFKIGWELWEKAPWIIILVAFVIGMLTVMAEPAIKILVTQVEETTNGSIKAMKMLFSMAIGVGIAIALAMTRIIYQFSLLYIIIPGYLICFILSFFVPKIYTAIAFDAGGVASGPLTSSFILPIALGLCSAVFPGDGNSVLSYGFGIVSLVALAPLVSIEILGVCSDIARKRHVRKEIRKALDSDDRVIINFGD